MPEYKIVKNPANRWMYDVHYWTQSKKNGGIRTPFGWVEKLNENPLTKNEAKALVEEHKDQNNDK